MTQAINAGVVAILVFVATATAAGVLVDWCLARQQAILAADGSAGGPRLEGSKFRTVGMMISSYCLLIPGLVLPLFSTDVAFIVFGHPKTVSSVTENMLGVIARMWDHELYVGAVIVCVYAIVIPLAKIVVLVLGHAWQRDPSTLRRARFCLRTVQLVSKWASPDMFAYILMAFLFRSMNNPPGLRSEMQLDLGFACFCVFCLFSTISSLGLKVPALPNAEFAEPQKAKSCSHPVLTALLVCFGLAFMVLMLTGLSITCMELKLDMGLLYAQRPELAGAKSFIDTLNLPDLMHQQVSGWKCIYGLLTWSFNGDINSALALVMYGGFAVALPILDVGTLFLATRGDGTRLLEVSTKLKKLSMLDVSIMGVLIVVLSLRGMRKKGIVISLGPGTVVLLAAEICHYAISHIVRSLHANKLNRLSDVEHKGCAAREISCEKVMDV